MIVFTVITVIIVKASTNLPVFACRKTLQNRRSGGYVIKLSFSTSLTIGQDKLECLHQAGLKHTSLSCQYWLDSPKRRTKNKHSSLVYQREKNSKFGTRTECQKLFTIII